LLFSFVDTSENGHGETMPCQVTKTLMNAMQHPASTKTYLALCDGDGTWNDEDYREKGWFAIDRSVKDEHGKLEV
jgi:hypothetical protein